MRETISLPTTHPRLNAMAEGGHPGPADDGRLLTPQSGDASTGVLNHGSGMAPATLILPVASTGFPARRRAPATAAPAAAPAPAVTASPYALFRATDLDWPPRTPGRSRTAAMVQGELFGPGALP